jgi:hypothetical protein
LAGENTSKSHFFLSLKMLWSTHQHPGCAQGGGEPVKLTNSRTCGCCTYCTCCHTVALFDPMGPRRAGGMVRCVGSCANEKTGEQIGCMGLPGTDTLYALQFLHLLLPSGASLTSWDLELVDCSEPVRTSSNRCTSWRVCSQRVWQLECSASTASAAQCGAS